MLLTPNLFPRLLWPRISWQLRLWLLPAIWLGGLLCTFGCGFSAIPPTLQVIPATPTATPAIAPTASPTPEAGAVADRPTAPTINAMLDQVESDGLMLSVDSLANFGSRHVLSRPSANIGGIGAAHDWLLAQFTHIEQTNPEQNITSWTQEFQYFWNGYNIKAQNVVCVMQGTDVGAGVVVVGAHYDSITTDFTNGQAYAPGANDNGSGVAAMLEAARIIASQPHRATIMFVAFAAEETGKQGSQAFVKAYLQAQKPPIDVRAMINLDIVGSEIGQNGNVDDHTLRIFSADPNNSPSRQFARQIALSIKTYDSELEPVIQSAEERTGRWGDHQSFREAGYSAIRLIQGLEDVSRQHTPRDTADGVQPAYLMKTTRALLVSLAVVAGGPPPPTDVIIRTKVDSPSEQRLVWTPVVGATQYMIVLRQSSSLFFDEAFTVKAEAAPELTRSGLDQYTTVAIATIDGNGRMGPLTQEYSIADLIRK